MGIDANTAIAGNQAFRWVGTAALTGAGQVGYFTSGGNTIIRGSNDADAASEFEIQLTGSKTLTDGRLLPVAAAVLAPQNTISAAVTVIGRFGATFGAHSG